MQAAAIPGKTYKQKLKELQQEVNNPRTGKNYKSEAEILFTTLALIEQELREGNIEIVKLYTQGCLQELGFDLVDILTNKCLLDGAYNEQS